MKVGVVLRLAEDLDRQDRGDGRCPSYAEIRETARRMEDAGFDVIWFADHLLYRRSGLPTMGIWECWTVLSAIAAATTRIELGTSTVCTSFRNPAVLAKMAATLDEVSQGRLILGLGAGWNEPEYRAFGLQFDKRVDRFEEALQIILPLLRHGHVDFEGRYYTARDCELAARYADVWNPVEYLSSVARFGELREAFVSAQQAVGDAAANVETSAILKV